MNAGKDKIIFREDVHPYLKLTNVTKSRHRNFDLPFVPRQVKPAPAVKREAAPKVSVRYSNVSQNLYRFYRKGLVSICREELASSKFNS
jgi:hypothetical protein